MDIIGGEQDKQDREIQITIKIVFIGYMLNTLAYLQLNCLAKFH